MCCGSGGVVRGTVYAVAARGSEDVTYARDINVARTLKMQLQAAGAPSGSSAVVVVRLVPEVEVPPGAKILTAGDVTPSAGPV